MPRARHVSVTHHPLQRVPLVVQPEVAQRRHEKLQCIAGQDRPLVAQRIKHRPLHRCKLCACDVHDRHATRANQRERDDQPDPALRRRLDGHAPVAAQTQHRILIVLLGVAPLERASDAACRSFATKNKSPAETPARHTQKDQPKALTTAVLARGRRATHERRALGPWCGEPAAGTIMAGAQKSRPNMCEAFSFVRRAPRGPCCAHHIFATLLSRVRSHCRRRGTVSAAFRAARCAKARRNDARPSLPRARSQSLTPRLRRHHGTCDSRSAPWIRLHLRGSLQEQEGARRLPPARLRRAQRLHPRPRQGEYVRYHSCHHAAHRAPRPS